MFDIRKYMQETLDDFFYDKDIEVWPEEKLNDIKELPNEYIVFGISDEIYTQYADNIPIWKEIQVFVCWIGSRITIKSKRVSEITNIMTQKGFKVKSIGKDLKREENSKYNGFISRFAFIKKVNGYE